MPASAVADMARAVPTDVIKGDRQRPLSALGSDAATAEICHRCVARKVRAEGRLKPGLKAARGFYRFHSRAVLRLRLSNYRLARRGLARRIEPLASQGD